MMKKYQDTETKDKSKNIIFTKAKEDKPQNEMWIFKNISPN